MNFFVVATTMPTVRRFSDRPLDHTTIERILETANMAPSGSNAQPWEFVIVRDPAARREIQKLYELAWVPYKDSAIIRGRATLSAPAQKALRVGDEFPHRWRSCRPTSWCSWIARRCAWCAAVPKT